METTKVDRRGRLAMMFALGALVTACAACATAPPPPATPLSTMPQGGSAPPASSPQADRAEQGSFDFEAARAAVQAVSLSHCSGMVSPPFQGSLNVEVQFKDSGAVDMAFVNPNAFDGRAVKGTNVERCVVDAIRTARIRPFNAAGSNWGIGPRVWVR